MKKRNLFIVMLLVAIAAFSLMSCEASPKNERGPVPESKIEVTYPRDNGYNDNVIVNSNNGMTTYIRYFKNKRSISKDIGIPSDEEWYISGQVFQYIGDAKEPISAYAIVEKWKDNMVHFTSFVTGNNIYGEMQPGCMMHIDGMYNLLSTEKLPASPEILPMNCGWIAIVQDLNDSSVMDLSQELYVDFIDERNVPEGYQAFSGTSSGYHIFDDSYGATTVKITEMSPLTTHGTWKLVDSLPPMSEDIKKTIEKNYNFYF